MASARKFLNIPFEMAERRFRDVRVMSAHAPRAAE
jgi:hypothetical protein